MLPYNGIARNLMKYVVSVCLLVASAAASASHTCTMDNLTRVVSIVYSTPGQDTPCEVLYEKPTEGQSMTLWRAENQAGYCEARASEFVAKLGTLGWQCTADQASENTSEPTPEQTSGEVTTQP